MTWWVNLKRGSQHGDAGKESLTPKLSLILLGGRRKKRRLAYLRQKLLNALGYTSFWERWMQVIPEDRRQEQSALDTQSMAGNILH